MTAHVKLHAASLEVLPEWPPSSIGWARIDAPPIPGEVHTHIPPRPRVMQPSDFGHWTPEGRETLRRILERVLRANGRRP